MAEIDLIFLVDGLVFERERVKMALSVVFLYGIWGVLHLLAFPHPANPLLLKSGFREDSWPHSVVEQRLLFNQIHYLKL